MMKLKKNYPEMIRINGKIYAMNLSKVCDFISQKTQRDVMENEILDTYDVDKATGDRRLNGKTIRELKTAGNGQENIVYDLVKIFIIQVIAYDEVELDFDTLPFGVRIAFNTLLSEGFLEEING
jgi:hypothetical protein